MTLLVPALASPEGATPSARRNAWRALSESEKARALGDLVAALRALPDEDVSYLADVVGLPLAEVVASPFALRAVALAATIGARTVAHETRAEIPWPADFATDPAVANDPHGYWERGVLHAGKYRSFLQDEPFTRFNPNHMSKWGPHELTHRTCGFFWRPEATRWETYLGARLNELVPVVLWYGLDEVARLDRDGFDRKREADDREATLARALWWSGDLDAAKARVRTSTHFLDEGLDHFDAEFAAIRRELAEGVVVPHPHPFLDASSDAIAYVVGHFDRLSSDAFEVFGDAFFGGELAQGAASGGAKDPVGLADRFGVFGSVAAYAEHVELVLDTLLFTPFELDFALASARTEARLAWDHAHRVAHHERARIDAFAEPMNDLAASCRARYRGQATNLPQCLGTLTATLPRSASGTVYSTGLSGGHDLDLLADGLASLAPATAAALESLDWDMNAFADGPLSRRDLADRLQQAVAEFDAPWLTSLCAFESAIASARVRDDVAERLGAVTWDGPGTVSASAAFRLVHLETDPTEIHAEWATNGTIDPSRAGDPVSFLVGACFDEVSVVPAPENVVALWEALATSPVSLDDALEVLTTSGPSGDDEPQTADEWLEELALAGAVAVLERFSPA